MHTNLNNELARMKPHSHYSQMVHVCNVFSQNVRSVLYRPLLRALTKLGVTANIITTLRFVSAFAFFLLFQYSTFAAGILLMCVFLSDTIDGSLARFQNKQSDRGKFLDIFADHVVYSSVILRTLDFGVDPLVACLHVALIPTAYLLAVIRYEENRPTDWIIKPYPRMGYLRAPCIVAFFSQIFFHYDFLEHALNITNMLSVILIVYFYAYIQIRWKKTLSN